VKLSSDNECLMKELQQLQEQHQQWWEQALSLKGELKSLGCPHHPGEDSAQRWLVKPKRGTAGRGAGRASAAAAPLAGAEAPLG